MHLAKLSNPLGDKKWQVETATEDNMLSTLNERGRPREDV